jgi:hypothetical protein
VTDNIVRPTLVNHDRFHQDRKSCPVGKDGGCFAIYSIRELSIILEAHKVIFSSREALKNLIIKVSGEND